MAEMKERLQAMQGSIDWKAVELDELCLAPEVPIPKKFKVPDFSKYDGSGDPLYHLKSYCTKMSVWSRDEKFLINFFHESLTGSALHWFMKLERSKLKKWGDLTDAFMRQYKFNLNVAPTREQLKALKKKGNESFKEYAQRWRALAAEVQPPLIESELCSYFIRTLIDPYRKYMLGTHVRDFADLIEVGERVDADVREGLLEATPHDSKKNVGHKKKESEVNDVHAMYSQYRQPYQHQAPFSHQGQHAAYQPGGQAPNNYANYHSPNPTHVNQQPMYAQGRGPRPFQPPRDDRPLPNFNVSRAELFRELVAKKLMGPRPAKAFQPPYPAWYDANATCEYHMGVAGHSLDKCDAFRRHVLALLDNGHIGVKANNAPNIINNPLPEHDKGKQVAMIGEGSAPSKCLHDISCSMKQLHNYLENAGYISKTEDTGRKVTSTFCDFHEDEVGHNIEGCTQFKELAQRMLKLGIISIRSKEDQEEVCTSSEGRSWLVLNTPPAATEVDHPSPTASKLIYEVREAGPTSSSLLVVNAPTPQPKQPAAVIHVPAPFPYKSNRAVPWNYGLKIECHTTQSPAENVAKISDSEVVGGITRSGRIYTKDMDRLREGPAEIGESSKAKDAGESRLEEVDEFLRIVKQSEYDVIEQLKKTPARISILSLVLSSEAHRKALLDVLGGAYVRPDTTPERVVNMVNIMRNATAIAFSEDEIYPTISGRPKALHITLKCYGYVIAKVLIDGGSALNVLPMSTLGQLPVELSRLEQSDLIVRAFDGTRREVVGNVHLPLEIGPSLFTVEFQVMDIDAAYTMLLGRPWIHMAGAVPSTLHQRVKFIQDGKLITVKGEEELVISKPSAVPYIENAEQETESPYQSFEVMETPKPSKDVNQVVAKIMENHSFKQGEGLGARRQGRKEPIQLPENPKRQGLGYDLSLEDMLNKQLRVCKGRAQPVRQIPHIRETFPAAAEIINMPDSVATAQEEEGGMKKELWIQPDSTGEALCNWEFEIIPDVMTLE